jgi:putative addiction module killer protein
MIKLLEYLDEDEASPFADWFESLEAVAAAKVTSALIKLEHGHFGNIKSVGKGLSEYRINYGPGYRIYLAKDGDKLIILLGGGSKKSQQKDIQYALDYWDDYKKRSRQERTE